MKITNIMINTPNPLELSRFWKVFLGVDESNRTDDYLWLQPASKDQPSIGFQKNESADTPQNFHFDVLVDDKEQATKKVVELGGSLVKEGKINNIVADPEGNEFDLYEEFDKDKSYE